MSYTIHVPVYLYSDSDAAYTRDESKRGQLWTTLGPHPIANTAYDGKVIAIKHPTGGYVLGWVNDEDNASSSTIASFDSFTVGDSVPIEISRKSSEFTHRVTLLVNNVRIWEETGVGTATTMTLGVAQRENLYREATDTMRPAATLRVTTYKGTSQIGNPVSKTVTATIPQSIYDAHTLTSVSRTEQNGAVYNLYLGSTVYVQGQSIVTFNATASGLYGSTVRSFRIDWAGATTQGEASNGTFEGSLTPVKSGTQTATVTMTDSRGGKTTHTVTTYVRAYEPPSLSAVRYYRSTASGVRDSNGTNVFLSYNTEASSLQTTGGSERNGLRMVITRRLMPGATTTVFDSSYPELESTAREHIFSDVTISSSARFTLTLQDNLMSTMAMFTVSTISVPGSWDKSGFAAGKVKQDSKYALEVGGESLFEGHVQIPDHNITASVVTAPVISATTFFGNDVEILGRKQRATDITAAHTAGAPGVTGLSATYCFGLVTLAFNYKPAVGRTTDVVAVTEWYRPMTRMVIPAYSSTVSDNELGITAYIDNEGKVQVVAPTEPSYAMTFSVTYIAVRQQE